jgi:beta-fructofuranosidase
MDHSGWEGFYAPNSLEDGQGRRIMWGWLTENARGNFEGISEWAGVQSIPRMLSLDSNDQLRVEPASELQSLRYDLVELRGITIDHLQLKKEGRALEMIVDFIVPEQGHPVGLHVLKSPDGDEQTSIVYHKGLYTSTAVNPV